MLNILLITNLYSDTDTLRQIIGSRSDRYSVSGIASNSVAGMPLIESVRPDVVIMPAFMTFWNASDLISNLLIRGICPLFILISEDGGLSYGSAIDSKIVSIISPEIEGSSVLAALEKAERMQDAAAPQQKNSQHEQILRHSMDVMNLLTGMIPLSLAELQMEYNRLRVGRQDCWIILAAPEITDQSNSLLYRIDTLADLFLKLFQTLDDFGDAELCVYQEKNLCILLANDSTEPDWGVLIQKVSRDLASFGLAPYVFQLSDNPLPLAGWHDACQNLLSLRSKRYFFSPLYLQPKMLASYKASVSQEDLLGQLSEISASVQNLNRDQLIHAFRTLESMVKRSLSQDVCSMVFTQLAIIYNRLIHQFSLQQQEKNILLPSSNANDLHSQFRLFEERYLQLYEMISSDTTSNSKLILDLQNYIDQHLQDKLSLNELADHVHMNQSYLSRLFREKTGLSLTGYISLQRVNRAKQLLQGPYKIITIAEMTGFNDAHYFSQVFRRHTGKTPKEYRKEMTK